MNKYQFLFKPLFFIINLLLATWLVLVVESIKPSDFNRYRSLFTSTPKTETLPRSTLTGLNVECKTAILKAATDYKAGIIDSVEFGQEVEKILKEKEEKK